MNRCRILLSLDNREHVPYYLIEGFLSNEFKCDGNVERRGAGSLYHARSGGEGFENGEVAS